jgi:hypothetical protein
MEKKIKVKIIFWKSRGHSDLNQGPAGLQPDALPLSYIPCVSVHLIANIKNIAPAFA